MSEVFKFPNGGYDVTVCKKQDILDCIDENIVDKEIALAIVEHCELAAANFIKEGRWTNLPFIGNVRVPKHIQMHEDPAQQALIEDAKEILDKEQYIMFRHNLNIENAKHIKQERYYNYNVTLAINKNKLLYNRLVKKRGELYARIYLYASRHVTAINNEYVNLEDDEQ